MPSILPLIFSFFFFVGSVAPLSAETVQPPVKDLEAAVADLQENLKDLRRNIAAWRKIRGEAQLSQTEKDSLRDRAKAYLQECQDYMAALERVDVKKIPPSEALTRFTEERRTFQRELLYFHEVLEEP